MNYLHNYHIVTDTGKNQRAVFFKVDHRRFGPKPMGGPSDFQFGFQFITNRLMHRFIRNFQTLFVR